jgi:hypothetical protein
LKTPVILPFLPLAVFFLLTCNNPSSNDKGGCAASGFHGCDGGGICVYVHLSDANGTFIKEMTGAAENGMNVYWDGTDCRGNRVGCGKYTIRETIEYNGQTTSQTSSVLIKDSASVAGTGRAACDSLRKNCTGTYAESPVSTLGDYGISGDVGCICCK